MERFDEKATAKAVLAYCFWMGLLMMILAGVLVMTGVIR